MRYIHLSLLLIAWAMGINAQVDYYSDNKVSNDLTNNCISDIQFNPPATALTDAYLRIRGTGLHPISAESGYTYLMNKSPGCITEGALYISFHNSGGCNASDFFGFTSTSTEVVVLFDGHEVPDTRRDVNDEEGEDFIGIPISDLNLPSIIGTPRIVPLELSVLTHYYSTTSPVNPTTITTNHVVASIMVVENDDRLTFRRVPQVDQHYDICDFQALSSIGDVYQNISQSELIIRSTLTDITTSTNSSSFSADYQLQVKVGVEGEYTNKNLTISGSASSSVSAGQSFSYDTEQIQENSVSQTENLVLPPYTNGQAAFIGIRLIGGTGFEQEFQVTCTDLAEGLVTLDEFICLAIQPISCIETRPIPAECEHHVYGFSIESHDRLLASGRSSNGDCTISITAWQETEPSYLQSILWEGPNGFTDVGNTIENVPAGIYHVTVFDECGQQTEYTVNACEGGLVSSDWMFDEASNELCRTTSCDGTNDCSGMVTEECISPEFGEWKYNEITREACRNIYCPSGDICNASVQCVTVEYGAWDYSDDGLNTLCFRDIRVFGEIIGQDEHPSIITYEYNDILERCFRYTRCSDPYLPIPTLVNTESEGPYFEDWDYNEFTEVCIREVRCFDLTDEQVLFTPDIDFENIANSNWENTNQWPQFSWEYDEVWGCTGYVFCDPFESTLNPIFDSDWELGAPVVTPIFNSVGYDENQLTNEVRCILDVDCAYNGIAYDTPQAFPPLTSEPIDPINAFFVGSAADFGYCVFEYQCGNQPLQQVPGAFSSFFDPSEPTQCIAYCEGFRETTAQPAIPCPTLRSAVFELGQNELTKLKSGEKYQVKWQDGQFAYDEKKGVDENTVVHPNPFDKSIILENLPSSEQRVKVVILNANGQSVLEQHYTDVTKARVDTQNLSPGIYLLMILGENEEILYQRKLIKV